jgi:hypothetical protein
VPPNPAPNGEEKAHTYANAMLRQLRSKVFELELEWTPSTFGGFSRKRSRMMAFA